MDRLMLEGIQLFAVPWCSVRMVGNTMMLSCQSVRLRLMVQAFCLAYN
jgi:hypothetical protein